MPRDNVALWSGIILALIAALTALYRDWRKPSVDKITGAKLRTEVNKAVDEREERLGQRATRIEDWAFEEVRPWGHSVVVRDEFVMGLLIKAYEELKLPMPPIPPLLPMPKLPPPLPT